MCKQLKELIKRGFAPLNEKSKSSAMEKISNNSVSQSLIGMLNADFSVSDDEAENIVSNYVYLTQLVKQDLLEIEANLTMLKDREKNTPAEDTYLHKKIRHFYALNQKAKDDVIDFLTKKMPRRFEPADGPLTLRAALFTVDTQTRRTVQLERITVEE